MNFQLNRAHVILGTIFLIAFTSQITLWLGVDYVDEDDWQRDSEALISGATPNFADDVLVHPGTAILLPTAALILVGIPSKIALNIIIALYISICATLVVAICRATRPQSLWWIGVAILTIFNPLYSLATAPASVAGAIVPLLIMLVFYLRNQSVITTKMLAITGVCAGVLLANRIDTGLAVCFFSFFYLWYLVGARVWIFFFIAPLTFVALDPYIWTAPVEHLGSIAQLINANVTVTTVETPGYTGRALSLAVVAVVLAVLSTLRAQLTSMPRDFVWYIVPMFVVVCTLISMAAYHPMRYFFPFSNALEIFLPLLVFDIIDRSASAYSERTLSLMRYAFLGSLVVARAVPALILIV